MSWKKFLVSSLSMLFIGSCTEGLDMESAKEQPCFDVESRLVPLDLNWVGTIGTIFYPVMSRLELYRVSADLLRQEGSNITEASLYYDSCFYWNMYPNGTIISRGYNGSYREYTTNLLSPNMEKFEFKPTDGPAGYSGTVYTTLTDNSTFLFTPFCTDDGQMAWGLGSTIPILSDETIQRIYEHAESLGFNREYFTELRYDRCDIGIVDESSTNSDSGVGSSTTTTVATTEAAVPQPQMRFRYGGWGRKWMNRG